jgi:serine O-acetyltransferase
MQVLAVDLHPAARLGHGILLDHGTGVVIGETAVIGNNVSLLQVSWFVCLKVMTGI